MAVGGTGEGCFQPRERCMGKPEALPCGLAQMPEEDLGWGIRLRACQCRWEKQSNSGHCCEGDFICSHSLGSSADIWVPF